MFGIGLAKKKVVILGGGFAGLNTAILLNKASSTPFINLDITLIDNKDSFIFYPLLYETLTGEMTFDDIMVKYEGCSDLKGVTFRKCEVKSINPMKKYVEVGDDQIDFDILVISLGSNIRVPSNLSNKPNVFVFKDPLDVDKLKHQISYQLKRYLNLKDKDDLKNSDKSLLESILTFVIVGAESDGIELSSKFSDFLKSECSNENIDPNLAKIFLIDVNEKLIQNLDLSTSKKVGKELKKKNIELLLGTTLHKLEDNVCTLVGKEKIDIPCGTVIWTRGTDFNPVISDLGINSSAEGKIIVNEYLESNHSTGVFAIGDNAVIEKNKISKPLPQKFTVAVQQAYICSYNIIADILRLPKIPYNYLNLGDVLTLGEDSTFVRVLGNRLEGNSAKWVKNILYAFAYPSTKSTNEMRKKMIEKAKDDGILPKWIRFNGK